jgi:gluconolactonase
MIGAATALFLATAIATPAATLAQQATPAAGSAATEARSLSRAQIDALLAKPSEVLILDVRRADEISVKGGFPVYLSVQLADLERFLPFIPRDRAIIPVSNHAGRARKAAALLSARGFRVAGVAGVDGYAAEGGTLTGQKPGAVAAAGAAATAGK